MKDRLRDYKNLELAAVRAMDLEKEHLSLLKRDSTVQIELINGKTPTEALTMLQDSTCMQVNLLKFKLGHEHLCPQASKSSSQLAPIDALHLAVAYR